MLTSYPAHSLGRASGDLLSARPLLDGSTECPSFGARAEFAERARQLGVSDGIRSLLEGLAIKVDNHYPWPNGASAQGPSPSAAAGCGVTGSDSVNGESVESTAVIDGERNPDAEAGLVLPPLPPSGIDPALRQEPLFAKTFRNGWEPDLPDVGQTLDDLRRRVLDEIMEFLDVMRARQIIRGLIRMGEAQAPEGVTAELIEELCQIMHRDGCAPGMAHIVLWKLRSDSDDAIRAFVELFFHTVYLIRFPEERGRPLLRP